MADFGAGSGFFLKPLSRAVGDAGIVYALEIQKTLVESLGVLINRENLGNVRPLWCDIEKLGGSKLPDSGVDVVILANTLFQVEEHSAVVAEIHRVLRSGGKAVVIDWTESWGGLGPQPSDIVSQETTEQLFEQAGFTTEGTFDAGDHHYGVAFRKP